MVLAFLVSSCTSNQTAKLVEQLYSSEFVIPDGLTSTYNGVDSTLTEVIDSPVRLVVYMDSVQCLSCSLSKMHVWGKYIDFAKVSNGKFSILYIIHPSGAKSEKTVRTTLRLHPIDYPIFVDKEGDFERLNKHLPKDNRFHTFLIDSSGKALFVGSPTNNKELENLFFKVVTEKMMSVKSPI